MVSTFPAQWKELSTGKGDFTPTGRGWLIDTSSGRILSCGRHHGLNTPISQALLRISRKNRIPYIYIYIFFSKWPSLQSKWKFVCRYLCIYMSNWSGSTKFCFAKIKIAGCCRWLEPLHKLRPTTEFILRTNIFRSFIYKHFNLIGLLSIGTSANIQWPSNVVFLLSFFFLSITILVKHRRYICRKLPEKWTPPPPILLFRVIIPRQRLLILIQPQIHHKLKQRGRMREVHRRFRLIIWSTCDKLFLKLSSGVTFSPNPSTRYRVLESREEIIQNWATQRFVGFFTAVTRFVVLLQIFAVLQN